ncbi:probable ATP-dependent RNA helicase DDX49 [Sycon ciliatum]|uniref:probable ATP-dependent RNA helicase DDX49 n=1 Tax=Sycon ciliatum TaxID=27933 RepID=UPI0020A8660D
MSSFEELGVSKWLVRQANAMAMRVPTPVQASCIPEILSGRDCVGCAKTGSGKTAAFALPILQKLSEDPYGVFCLVLTPVRELAYQIAEQFRVLGKPLRIRVAVVVGGRDMLVQSKELADKPHIIVATPGRLAHHLNITDTCRLDKIKYLVLDEADRVLEETMMEDVNVVLKALPKKRQTLLFTATIEDLLDDIEDKPEDKRPFVFIGESSEATVPTVKQQYVLCPQLVRDVYLVHVLHDLHDEKKNTIIVFTATCKNCQILCMLFNHVGIPAVALHSLMSQNGRLASLSKFRAGQVRVLVATDLAGRGLDIPTVEVVLNSNTPASPTDYIHRVGRTARAGRGGLAITMVTQFDIVRLHAIEDRIGKKLETLAVEEDDVDKLLEPVRLSRKQLEVDLGMTDFGEQRQRNKEKWDRMDPKKQDQNKRKKKKSGSGAGHADSESGTLAASPSSASKKPRPSEQATTKSKEHAVQRQKDAQKKRSRSLQATPATSPSPSLKRTKKKMVK